MWKAQTARQRIQMVEVLDRKMAMTRNTFRRLRRWGGKTSGIGGPTPFSSLIHLPTFHPADIMTLCHLCSHHVVAAVPNSIDNPFIVRSSCHIFTFPWLLCGQQCLTCHTHTCSSHYHLVKFICKRHRLIYQPHTCSSHYHLFKFTLACRCSLTRMLSCRHHCRACGHVFCQSCSARRVELPQLGYSTPQRVRIWM